MKHNSVGCARRRDIAMRPPDYAGVMSCLTRRQPVGWHLGPKPVSSFAARRRVIASRAPAFAWFTREHVRVYLEFP